MPMKMVIKDFNLPKFLIDKILWGFIKKKKFPILTCVENLFVVSLILTLKHAKISPRSILSTRARDRLMWARGTERSLVNTAQFTDLLHGKSGRMIRIPQVTKIKHRNQLTLLCYKSTIKKFFLHV